jgi:type III secretion protein L
MAFIVPRSPLKPARSLELGLPAGTVVVRAAELAAWHDASSAVAHALAQAQDILGSAEAALEAEKQRGHADGLEQARMEHAEQMIVSVASTIDYFNKVEGRMVDLVMQAVQKIIHDFDDNERVLITVKNVLSVVRNQKQLTLKLNPQEVEAVKARVNDLLAAYPGIGYIDIVSDHRLASGACLLESEIGLVEASMDSQLAALRSAFERILGNGRAKRSAQA